MGKREYYAEPSVAAAYEADRSARGAGPARRREVEALVSLLPPADAGLFLDLATGPGFAAIALRARGARVVLGDWSVPMLLLARDSARAPAVRLDAFSLPFRGRSFDGVTALRLLFHYPDPSRVLAEIARLLRPGGIAIVDTILWSPKQFLPEGALCVGGRVHPRSIGEMTRRAARFGLAQEAVASLFAAPGYLYRYLPASWAESLLARERSWGRQCKTRHLIRFRLRP